MKDVLRSSLGYLVASRTRSPGKMGPNIGEPLAQTKLSIYKVPDLKAVSRNRRKTSN